MTLTPASTAALRLLIAGLTQAEMAAHLGVSLAAVSLRLAPLRARGVVRRGRLTRPVAVHAHKRHDPCTQECSMPSPKPPRKLRDVLAVYTDDKRGRARPEPPSSVEESMAATYVAARRGIDPLYDGSPRLLSAMRGVAAGLRAARVPEPIWPSYVVWVCREFAGMTGGRVPVCPVDRLASQTFLDRFALTLPARKVDPEAARRWLRARNYHGSVSAVLEVVRDRLEGRQPAPWPEPVLTAAEAILGALDSIGTVEVDRGA